MSLETLVIFKVPGGQLYSRKADTLVRLPQLGEKTLIAGTMYEVEDVIYNITPDDGNVQLINLLGVLAGQSGSNPAAAAAALAKITPLDPGGAMFVTRGFSTPDLVVVVVLGEAQRAAGAAGSRDLEERVVVAASRRRRADRPRLRGGHRGTTVGECDDRAGRAQLGAAANLESRNG